MGKEEITILSTQNFRDEGLTDEEIGRVLSLSSCYTSTQRDKKTNHPLPVGIKSHVSNHSAHD